MGGFSTSFFLSSSGSCFCLLLSLPEFLKFFRQGLTHCIFGCLSRISLYQFYPCSGRFSNLFCLLVPAHVKKGSKFKAESGSTLGVTLIKLVQKQTIQFQSRIRTNFFFIQFSYWERAVILLGVCSTVERGGGRRGKFPRPGF